METECVGLKASWMAGSVGGHPVARSPAPVPVTPVTGPALVCGTRCRAMIVEAASPQRRGTTSADSGAAWGVCLEFVQGMPGPILEIIRYALAEVQAHALLPASSLPIFMNLDLLDS